MQTQNLLPQLSSANTLPQRANALPQSESGGLQFSQALSREITQRQNAVPAAQAQPQVQSQAPAKPAAQPRQADKAQAPKQDAAKPAQAEPARDAQGSEAAEGTETAATQSSAPAEEQAAGQSAAEAAARAAEQPVTDMLALVASFSQLTAAIPKEVQVSTQPGGPMPAAAENADAAQPDLAAQFGQGATLVLGEQTGAAKQPAGGEQAATPGFDDGAQGTVEVPADLKADVSKFASALRERAEPAPLKDSAAAAAPLAGPAAQASLSMAQAVAGAAGDKLSARVGTPAWDNQLGQKIVWMVAGKDQSATLTLNPPDLGPVQVVLNVTNDQASVAFSSAQLDVRQALENAMPKLREMLDESGIALGNATVDAGMPDQRQAQDERQAGGASAGGRFAGNGGGHGAKGGEAEVRPATRPVRAGGLPGMVDTFA